MPSLFFPCRERGGSPRGVPRRLQEHDALPHPQDLPVRPLRRLARPLPQQPHQERRRLPAVGHRQGRTGEDSIRYLVLTSRALMQSGLN